MSYLASTGHPKKDNRMNNLLTERLVSLKELALMACAVFLLAAAPVNTPVQEPTQQPVNATIPADQTEDQLTEA